MRSAKSLGRIVGVLLLLHLVIGLTTPYILMTPLNKAPTAFLAAAADLAPRLRLAVMMLFAGAALMLAIVSTAWPLFRARGEALAVWLAALAAANLALQAGENAGFRSMLSLSQEYVKAGAAETGPFLAPALVVRGAWRWAHYTHLLVMVSWMLLLHVLFFRHALVPRVLAGLGAVACLLQLSGITFPALLGYHLARPDLFGMPLGVAYLALAGWLMARGFGEPVNRRTIPM
jgi:hypothetical protein